MKLKFIPPIPDLKPFISKVWLFENTNGLENHGTLIAPNARPKIIIPFKNELTTTANNKTTVCRQGDICFIGARDTPVTIGAPPGETGSIGIELTTEGAYRFLHTPMHELTNNLYSFSELYDKRGKDFIALMTDEENTVKKITLAQEFLLQRLKNQHRNNAIINYSIQFISASNGLATIKELEKKTGYTKRYLDKLFKNYLGLSPKTLATIHRFQSFYKTWTDTGIVHAGENSILDLYYDQSHFIKEFKRYTGYTPVEYSRFNNDFGKHF